MGRTQHSHGIYNGHKLTTRVSSRKYWRRYFAISTAMPFGSLTFFVRSSFRTVRNPSFHLRCSSGVLPGLAVPSWTRSFSPRVCKVSLRTLRGEQNISETPPTSNANVPEMLIGTISIVASTSCSLELTQRFFWVYLVAECP
jgi:hypothetical protein